MIQHIIIMILLLLTGVLLNNKKNNTNKKAYILIVFVVLFSISAFRSVNIGNDTWDYFFMFKKFGSSNDIFNTSLNIETGYIILNKILYTVSRNTLILTTFTSAFIIGIFTKLIYKKSKIIWLSVLLFINLRFFYFTLSGIRQSIALAIIILSYKFIKERKPIRFTMMVLLASTFHLTALAFLLIYPISKINFDRKVMIRYIAISSFLFLFFDYVINFILKVFPKYKVYLTSSYFEGIKLASIIDFFVLLSIFIFIYLLTENNSRNKDIKIRQDNSSNEKNITLHMTSLALCFSFIAINASLVRRTGLYFFIFTIIYIPNVIYNLKNKDLKMLLIYLVVIITFIYNMIILIYRPEWQHVYPYEFFWQIK